MAIESEDSIPTTVGQPLPTNWFRSAFDVLRICLQVHVLQRISTMQPIVAQGNCHLEDLRLVVCVFLRRCGICAVDFEICLLHSMRVLLVSAVRVLCSTTGVVDIRCNADGGPCIVVFAICMFWRTAGIFSSGVSRVVLGVSASSSHFRYLALLEALGFRQVCVPQAFAGHLLVEDAFALMHHEEPFMTMHDNIKVALDSRAPRLDEEARFARGDPDGAKSGENGGPHLPQSQTLRVEQ